MSPRAPLAAATQFISQLPPLSLGTPLLAYSRARSLGYSIEARLMYALAGLLPGAPSPEAATGLVLESVQKSMKALLEKDVANIEAGVYPASVLMPGSPVEHVKRLPWLVVDGIRAHLKRSKGRTTIFSQKAKEFLEELPRYYRRNFHFQTDGYLSEKSAELYDHQVELLFGGTADAMRRLAIPHLKRQLGDRAENRTLKILEIGSGTGAATRFVRLAFPKARITATDLSGPYLKVAQRKLAAYDRIDYLMAPGEELPFQDASYDAVFSVFLFHELPLEARQGVLKEALRVLKPGGALALVDSIQKSDAPEFDSLVAAFPKDFHEPFYRNYLEHPLRDLFKGAGFSSIEEEVGFVSLAISGRKA
ncbi:MAG TPA: methyltransferase domain-containing protein [Bdellovibrionota bacterium]|nr:methyltransferase domain-containing protein [Bdellovibrionota bacterium]